jgi:AraC family transcriptional regulator of adaptative response/methylated-DNA-[protein]-cysteine methyltransferase
MSSKEQILKQSWIDTPLGRMIAVADDQALYLLEFEEQRGLKKELDHLSDKTNAIIVPGRTKPIDQIAKELQRYFAGESREFQTPLALWGTPFQKRVWEELRKIPFGKTRSYSKMACAIGQPAAIRAAARANGVNPIAIVVPCHRVINASGELGGYTGGLERKKWLIDHERNTLGLLK